MALVKANKGSASPFKFDAPGVTLKGYYQGQVKKTINGMPAIEHTYKTASGLVGVLGQANILKQFENNGVLPGTYVEITFTGETMKLKGGRTMKVYDVAFDSENTDASPQAPSDEETADAEDDYGLGESEEEEAPAPIAARPTAPRAPAAAASPARQAAVQAMINKNRARTA